MRADYRAQIETATAGWAGVSAMSAFVIRHIGDPDVDYGELAEAVRYDPGVTATVLKMANSAYFGLRREVTTLKQAFAVLGTRRLFKLLIADTAMGTMAVPLTGYDLTAEDFVRHAAWTALAAEKLARRIGDSNGDFCFTCGLLHDLGKLPMDPCVAQERERVRDGLRRPNGVSFDELERELFGIGHPEAGARLLATWGLPEEIVTVAAHHHVPETCPEPHRIPARIVHMADMLAYAEGVGAGLEGTQYRFSEQSMQALDIDQTELEYIASQTLDEMRELARIFVPHRAREADS